MTRGDNDENKDIISGLCPKVKAEIQNEIEEDIENNKIVGNIWWWCGDKNQNCNFPFTINGQKHYKPVGGKCIAVGDINDQEFTEDDLVPCSPCPGNIFHSAIMALCL